MNPGALDSVIIEAVTPQIDCGRYAAKREIGDTLTVEADVFKEGHDRLSAVVLFRPPGGDRWCETPMAFVDNDRWSAPIALDRLGVWCFTIEAWTDQFSSWLEELRKKHQAGQDVTVERIEGAALIRSAAARAGGRDGERLASLANSIESAPVPAAAVAVAGSAELADLMARYPDRSQAVRYGRELPVVVEPVAARFAAWYEMFHRSQGTVPGRSATFADMIARLPEIAAMGFDVVYLPPIHPIGRTNRKGPNNTLTAGPDDPGSPYAIGGEAGGHDAVHPDLGTPAEFREFVAAAAALGMQVALDFAIQASPDHPWVREHPEWFFHRPDGSIKYAENPPKKYEDIYPLNFQGPARQAIWEEMRRVILHWVGQGVTTFRVDNPHTKPVAFWEWLIAEVKRDHPETIFLSEAFTRPKMLKALAKAGFSQSYTYFTWRNFKPELTEYLTELTGTEVAEYLRGNLFTNTPDILPPILVEGGRPAFKMRVVLAATLSSVYGIYNGYELCENRALPGKEEYQDSEKYEYKVWDWDRPGNIKDYIARLNAIRRESPALHEYDNLRFYPSSDDNVIFYGKMTPDRSNVILIAVNLDPFQPHETTIDVPIGAIGIAPDEEYQVTELLTGRRYLWRGDRQAVRLDPNDEPAAIYQIRRWAYKAYESPSY